MTAGVRDRGPWLLGVLLVLVTAGIGLLLVGSEQSGTGAENVGDDGRAPLAAATVQPAPSAEPAPGATPVPVRRCKPTRSNPGGTNNYIPDAPEVASLGRGFVITGLVRSARGCRPLEDVRIQVWL